MDPDEGQLRELAVRYTEAWCSGDPACVAAHYAPGSPDTLSSWHVNTLRVELVSDPSTREPDGPRATRIRDRLRHNGVLVGTTGRHGNVLKIRPPLAFTSRHVAKLLQALEAALAEITPA